MDSEFYKTDLEKLVTNAYQTLTPTHCMTFLVHVDKQVQNVENRASRASMHEFILKLSNEHIERLVSAHARAAQRPPEVATPASAPSLTGEGKATQEGATGDNCPTSAPECDSSWVELSE